MPRVNPESRKQYQATYSQRRREYNRAYHKVYYQQNKRRWASLAKNIRERIGEEEWLRRRLQYQLKCRFKLSLQDYEEMLRIQNYHCAICLFKFERGPGRSPHVDHDHGTGKVRGLLCTRCNNALERLESVPGWGELAQEYLSKLKRPR